MEYADHTPVFSILDLRHQIEKVTIKNIVACMQRGQTESSSSSYNKAKQKGQRRRR